MKRPDAEWTENRYCRECDNVMPHEVVTVDGETDCFCSFCGAPDDTFLYEGVYDDDAGGWD